MRFIIGQWPQTKAPQSCTILARNASFDSDGTPRFNDTALVKTNCCAVEPQSPGLVGALWELWGSIEVALDPLKIPEWLPTTSQATRLRVACRVLWPRAPIDSGVCGEMAEGRWPKAEKSRGNGEIREEMAKLNRPSWERRRSEYVAGGGQGGWPAMNSWGRSCQSATNWLARRNSTGPTGG